MAKAGKFNNSFNKRTILLNSFWGLEKAQAFPPNYVVTGPLYKPQGDLLPILNEKDETLFNWMNKAVEDG